ncbi:MAG: hypothetical protein K6B74_05520 [Ruminococcus sp.]|nr:hypothetical protein [Ruminococcus sp.]
MISYLTTVAIGGYDKRETMDALDSLNSRICLLYEEIEKKRKGRAFDVPMWSTVKMPQKAAGDGFDERDTDALITELRSLAVELENELLR